MGFSNSYRPQNRHPEGLLRSRQEIARANTERVQHAIRLLGERNIPSEKVTVPLVAQESGVSAATIYRRDDLFALVQRVNPEVQRRKREQTYHAIIERLELELARAQEETSAARKQLQLLALGTSRSLQHEFTRLTKENLQLQRRIAQLEQLQAEK